MPVFNVVAESVPEVSFNLGVPLCAILVNVDFPAYTTGVSTFVCNATEIVIKIGNS